MAKTTKKTVSRPTPAAAKYTRSSLVRVAPVAEAKAEAAAENAERATAVATTEATDTPKAAPKTIMVAPTATPKRVAPSVNVPTKAAAKSTVAAQAAQAAQAVRKGKSNVRSANPAPRAFIRAENFGYVVRDLRFIGLLALGVVIIMIVLRIVIKS